MATMKNYPFPPNANLNAILQNVTRELTSQGYTCQASVMSPQGAALNVSKDNDGVKNFIGMGVSCRCSIAVMGSQISVNIESEWTNKIIAIAIGWFLCLVPFITGIVGSVAQSGLPNKIDTAMSMAIAAVAGNGPMPQNPYQQAPYQQAQYQQNQYQQNPYQQAPYQQAPYQQEQYPQEPYQQDSYQDPQA